MVSFQVVLAAGREQIIRNNSHRVSSSRWGMRDRSKRPLIPHCSPSALRAPTGSSFIFLPSSELCIFRNARYHLRQPERWMGWARSELLHFAPAQDILAPTTIPSIHEVASSSAREYMERWMSGLNQQFTKLSAFTGPRVRISLSPPSPAIAGYGGRSPLETATVGFARRSFSEVGFWLPCERCFSIAIIY